MKNLKLIILGYRLKNLIMLALLGFSMPAYAYTTVITNNSPKPWKIGFFGQEMKDTSSVSKVVFKDVDPAHCQNGSNKINGPCTIYPSQTLEIEYGTVDIRANPTLGSVVIQDYLGNFKWYNFSGHVGIVTVESGPVQDVVIFNNPYRGDIIITKESWGM